MSAVPTVRRSPSLDAIALSPLLVMVSACVGRELHHPPWDDALYRCSPATGISVEYASDELDDIWLGLLDVQGGVWEETIEMELGESGEDWSARVQDERISCDEPGEPALLPVMAWDGMIGHSWELITFGDEVVRYTGRSSAGWNHWDVRLDARRDLGEVRASFWDVLDESMVLRRSLEGGPRDWSLLVSCFEVPCERRQFLVTFELWGTDGELVEVHGS